MMQYGYNQPSGPLEELKRFFRSGSMLSILIIANLLVWMLIQLFRVFGFLTAGATGNPVVAWVMGYFALPAFPPHLFHHPWTIVTYMFLHTEVWHILFNMLWLYWFGKIFTSYLGEKRLLAVYLAGGVAGGIVYIIAFNIFPAFHDILPLSFALGASASVMAIVTAISFHAPDYTVNLLFLGNVRIIFLAIFLFVFDFFMIPSGNAGGHFAHIGGAMLGFSYAMVMKRPRLRSTKKQTFSQQPQYERPVTDEEYNTRKRARQQRVDDILEKISKGGYDSLTKEEKEFLFNSSNRP